MPTNRYPYLFLSFFFLVSFPLSSPPFFTLSSPLLRHHSLFRPLGFSLSLAQFPHKDLCAPFTRVVFLSGLKARADANGNVPPIGGEGERGDAVGEFLVLLHPPLGLGIPEGDVAIATARGKGTVARMEDERVDGVDDVAIALGRSLPVALEGVLAGLGFGRVLEPLHGDAALDTTSSVAGIVGHAGHGAGEELEGGLALLPGVEGGCAGGEGFGGRRQVVDRNEAGGHGDDELRRARGEGVGLAR